MSKTQFRRALKTLGISQRGFARLIGSAERTVRRWALGEAELPESDAILLRLMLGGKITAEDVRNASRP
jgi:DNA-binding transcriptional regulator YiaG